MTPPRNSLSLRLRQFGYTIFGRAGLGAVEMTDVAWDWSPGDTKSWTEGEPGKQTRANIVARICPAMVHELGHMLHFALWPHASQFVRTYRAEAVAQFAVFRAGQLALLPWQDIDYQIRHLDAMSYDYRAANVIAQHYAKMYLHPHMDGESNVRIAREIFMGP